MTKSSEKFPRTEKPEQTTLSCFNRPSTGAMDTNKISWFINSLYLVFKVNRKIYAQEKMQNDVATMEESMAFPQKPNMKLVHSIAISFPRMYLE